MIDLTELGDEGIETLRGAYDQIKSGKASAHELAYAIKLLEAYEDRLSGSGTKKWFRAPYTIDRCPKHKIFFDAGKDYHERLFMASNRSGKSVSGAFETAVHLTGLYPEWWTGRRFDHPVNAWAAGQTGQTTRDTVQKELLGPKSSLGSGMIPKELILRTTSRSGVADAIDTATIRHVPTGGISTLGFKSYDQDIKAYYGTAMHVIWLDEECPELIFNECETRLMTTNGIIFVTFTPLHGLTNFIVNFTKSADFLGGAKRILALEGTDNNEDKYGYEPVHLWKPSAEEELADQILSSRAVVQAGWDDAAWLTEEMKGRMLLNTPPHLRDARSKGIPSLGAGNVYPIPVDEIKVDPFPIPKHWRQMYSLDVGWGKTAALKGAIDPETDTIYVTNEYYMGDTRPEVHAAAIKAWGDWMPGVIDPASRGRSQIDGNRLMTIYKSLGLRIAPAKNEVDTGINWTYDRLSCGKLKIFSNLNNLFSEYILYRRDLNGKIIKEKDHLMDALRYLVLNTRVAQVPPRPNNNFGGQPNYGVRKYRI